MVHLQQFIFFFTIFYESFCMIIQSYFVQRAVKMEYVCILVEVFSREATWTSKEIIALLYLCTYKEQFTPVITQQSQQQFTIASFKWQLQGRYFRYKPSKYLGNKSLSIYTVISPISKAEQDTQQSHFKALV